VQPEAEGVRFGVVEQHSRTSEPREAVVITCHDRFDVVPPFAYKVGILSLRGQTDSHRGVASAEVHNVPSWSKAEERRGTGHGDVSSLASLVSPCCLCWLAGTVTVNVI